MEHEIFTWAHLFEKVDELLQARTELEVSRDDVKEHNKNKPVQPDFVSDPKEWQDYIESVNEWDAVLKQQKEELVTRCEEELKPIESKLYEKLPRGTWFRIETKMFGEKWVGIKPAQYGEPSRILIRDEKPDSSVSKSY